MPTLDPDRYPPRPDGPAGGGRTLGDLIAQAAKDDPGEANEPPLCPCGHGYVGHASHGGDELPPVDDNTCPICDIHVAAGKHPCRFEVACACWRGVPCDGSGRVQR